MDFHSFFVDSSMKDWKKCVNEVIMLTFIKNIKTGRVFKRINKNSPIFTDGEDYIELVRAEIVDGNIIRIDTKGNQYSKIS